MIYVGTYSVRGSAGIYGVDFDAESGRLTLRGALSGLRNPSFLALHPHLPRVYSVCEMDRQGAVAALALDLPAEKSPLLNQQSSGGAGPCHVAVDPGGRCVVTANYRSGSVALLPIAEDGSLEPASDAIQHAGTGPDAERQEGPHAHSATFAPSGRFVVAADLGADKLFIYELHAAARELLPHAEVVVAPGSGPRHFAFHPTGRWAYLINELSNTVIAYSWDEGAGRLTELQTLSALPADFHGTSYTADIHLHPSGRFLYGSNRGHDSLAIFEVEETSGRLEARGHVSSGGGHPRNFMVTPDGRWLLCANRDSDNIVVFRLTDGMPKATGEELSLPAPVCLLWV